MDVAARLMIPALLGFTALVGALVGGSDDPETLRRVEAMPRERRLALSENLERFDKLPAAEQSAIRQLDADLARRDPVDRTRYREVLRRYHLWLEGLTDDQKRKLEEAGSDEARFNLATRLRRDDMAKKPYPGPRVAGLRTGDLGLIGPYEAAHYLKVWQKLPEATRADLAKRSGSRLQLELMAQGKALHIPFESFDFAEETQFDALLDKDPDFKAQLGPIARKAALKNVPGAVTKAELAQKRFQHPFAEFLYFEKHPPMPVLQSNLEKFAATCPPWFLVTLDPLSPSDARNYLTILYRLIYPLPREIGSPPDPMAKGASGSTPEPAKGAPRKTQGPRP